MPEDIYANFMTILAHFDATDSSAVEETTIDTGMTPFSSTPWGMSIAKVQVYIDDIRNLDAINLAACAISTQQGLAALPEVSDYGCIEKFAVNTLSAAAAGNGTVTAPWSELYIPTILVAAPKISVYCATAVDDANLQGTEVHVRIHFLSVPMTTSAWQEVAATWALRET